MIYPLDLTDLAEAVYSAEQPNARMYHYTNLSGLLGIVKEKKVWACDARYMNDAAEIKDFIKRISSYCGSRTPLENFERWFLGQFETKPLAYICSFTPNGNQLSQWRGYCEYGKGVSIGFNTANLISASKPIQFGLGKCIYDDDEKDLIAEAVAKSIQHECEKLGPSRGLNQGLQKYDHVFSQSAPRIIRIASLFKDSSFSEEAEWRLIAPVLHSNGDLVSYAPYGGVNFRASRNAIVPYITFPIDYMNEFIIDEVQVGPGPQPATTAESIRYFLKSTGFSERIVRQPSHTFIG